MSVAIRCRLFNKKESVDCLYDKPYKTIRDTHQIIDLSPYSNYPINKTNRNNTLIRLSYTYIYLQNYKKIQLKKLFMFFLMSCKDFLTYYHWAFDNNFQNKI